MIEQPLSTMELLRRAAAWGIKPSFVCHGRLGADGSFAVIRISAVGYEVFYRDRLGDGSKCFFKLSLRSARRLTEQLIPIGSSQEIPENRRFNRGK